MKYRVIHSRVEAREYFLDDNDLRNAVKAYVARSGIWNDKPPEGATVAVEVELDSDEGAYSAKLTQRFDYERAEDSR